MLRSEFRPLRLLLATLAPLLLLPSACLQGAQLENEKEIQDALGCDMPSLLKSCDGAGCHTGEAGYAPDGGVDLFAPGVPASLVGAPAIYPEAVGNYYYKYGMCPEQRELLIDPVDPDQSLILKKLNATQECGIRMPPDRAKLNDADVACFRQWVLDAIAEASASGGSTGTGGAAGAGGAAGTGGAGAGGALSTGGNANTGGALSSGGSPDTGGSASAAGGETQL